MAVHRLTGKQAIGAPSTDMLLTAHEHASISYMRCMYKSAASGLFQRGPRMVSKCVMQMQSVNGVCRCQLSPWEALPEKH